MSNGHDDASSHERYRDELAAYALGALDEAEAGELRRHLESCDLCRERLLWLRPAVDLLPRSVEQLEPPPELRRRLVATVRAEAREREETGHRAAAPRRWRDWGGLVLRPATAVAAGAFLVAGAVGGYLLNQPTESTSPITSSSLSSARASVAGTLEREDRVAILHLTRVPPLPKGSVYEVWVQRDGDLEPSSLFVPRRDRTADAAVPGTLDDADAVLVTREPRGGSEHPTSAPLLRAEVD